MLLYPGEKAISLENLSLVGGSQLPYNIIIIDGTWQQAKSMYHNCHHLHNLRQVSVHMNWRVEPDAMVFESMDYDRIDYGESRMI